MPKLTPNGPISLPAASYGYTQLKTAIEAALIATDDTLRFERVFAAVEASKVIPDGSPPPVIPVTPVPAPTLTLSSALVKVEGNSGTTTFAWTLTLNRDGSNAVFPYTWDIKGSGANPADAADFGGAFPTGFGSFAAGETVKIIPVLVIGDTSYEPDDTFTLTVNAAGLNTVTSTGTISNDDAVPATPTVSISAAQSKSEGNSGATILTYTVSRSAAVGAIVVPWFFDAGNTSANDFTGGAFPTGGTVAMADGVASGTFNISVNGDTTFEPDETFTVSVSAPSGYALGSPSSATGTILNDDAAPPPPTVFLSSAQSKAEGNSGATIFSYTVTRSTSNGAVNVPWSFAAGTTSADDFTGGAYPTGGTIAIADGATQGTLTVSVNGDTVAEADEAFTVSIAVPNGYAAGTPMSATGTILNDDAAAPALPATIQIVPEGDSLTAYSNVQGRPGWADQAVTGLIAGPTYKYRKVAQGGETAQAMDADFDKGTPPTAITPGTGSFISVGNGVGAGPAYDPSYAMNIMLLGPVGTNDNIAVNSFAVYRAIRNIVNKSYAKGYDRTLVSTLIPRNGVARDSTDTDPSHNYDANNIQINRDIAALWDSDIGADYMIDFAPIWPTQADYTIPEATVDGTHQSGPGMDKMAPLARTGLNAVIQSPGVKRMEPLTWSPWDGRSELALSEDKRTATAAASSGGYFRYGFPNLRSGKWYFEIEVPTGANTSVGLGTRGSKLYSTGATLTATANAFIEVIQSGEVKISGAAAPVAQLGARAVGDVICFALDADNHRLWIRRNALAWNGNSESVISTDPALQAGYIDISALRAYDLTASGRNAAYAPYIRTYVAMTAVTRFAAAEHARRRPGEFQALDLGATKVAAVVPTNLTIPIITGEAVVGRTLTASGDTWDNSPTSYTNTWTRGGVAVAGQTGRTYTVTAADVGQAIGYSRTPSNSAGPGAAAVAVPTYPALDTTSPWSPLVLGTKLFAWWKPSAASITGSGTATRWADEKGNAAIATQAFQGTVPAPIFSATARNGAPGAQIGGTSALGSNVSEKNFVYPSNNTAVGLFVAVSGYVPAGTTERVLFSLGDGVATRAMGIGVDASGLVEFAGGNATAFKPASAKTWGDQDRMVSVSYPGNGAGTTITIDGVTEALAITNRTGGSGRYRIGADSTGSGSIRYFNGIIQNIYLLSPLPTLIEQQKLEGYDSWNTGKAGANLPADHPFKARAPLAGDPS